MSIQNIVKVSVIILLALTGIGVMFAQSNSIYINQMMNETGIQNITGLEEQPQLITNEVKQIQSDLTSGSQFTGVDFIDKGITLLFVGWKAITTLLNTLMASLIFVSSILIFGPLKMFGLDWAAVPIIAFLGTIFMFKLLDIAFRGRFS